MPARGKTYISKKLSRYLNWIGINTRVFNLGEYRRTLEGYDKPSHEFFNHNNPEGVMIRRKVCDLALEDMFKWIEDKVKNPYQFDSPLFNLCREKSQYLMPLTLLETEEDCCMIE